MDANDDAKYAPESVQIFINRITYILLISLVLGGCTRTLIVKSFGKSEAQRIQEIEICKNYALQITSSFYLDRYQTLVGNCLSEYGNMVQFEDGTVWVPSPRYVQNTLPLPPPSTQQDYGSDITPYSKDTNRHLERKGENFDNKPKTQKTTDSNNADNKLTKQQYNIINAMGEQAIKALAICSAKSFYDRVIMRKKSGKEFSCVVAKTMKGIYETVSTEDVRSAICSNPNILLRVKISQHYVDEISNYIEC